MIATQELTFGITGQSITFDCPDGRPSAIVSCAVYEADADDTSTAEAATTGSPAVATNPNTTLAVSAGVGDQSITVTSVTGFAVDGRYLMTAAIGHREEFEVAGINGSALTLRHPLINAFASGATVATTRCTQAVDATWIADLQNISPGYGPNPRYRVRWVVTLGGVSQVYDRYLDVVRYPARHNVSPLDVVSRGARTLHAVDAVRHRDGFRLELIDAPLVAPGSPSLLRFEDRLPDLAGGWHVCLYANVWGTNFPMWCPGDARFRLTLGW